MIKLKLELICEETNMVETIEKSVRDERYYKIFKKEIRDRCKTSEII